MNMMPPITKNLLIINVLCYFASLAFASHGVDFDELFGLHFFLASHFQPWQFFTYMFMHANLQHLFFNMFAVWMFGRIMEQTMGQKRFLFYYLTCGLGAGLTQELVQLAEYWYYGFGNYEQVALGSGIVAMDEYLNRWNTVGASGAVYGILLSFGPHQGQVLRHGLCRHRTPLGHVAQGRRRGTHGPPGRHARRLPPAPLLA